MDNQTKNKPERIYSLDALRATMMLLGIVLHAGITYGTGNYQDFWPIKNGQTSIAFDIIIAIIHHFRMPVFFVTAGYFSALLFYRKGPRAMLLNRVKRILLPFLAGVCIVYPMSYFSFSFSKAAMDGNLTPFASAWKSITSGAFLPFNVLHLWFLYFLIFYSFAGWMIAIAFQKDSVFTNSSKRVFTFILHNGWLRIIGVSILIFLCLFWIGAPYLVTNNSWKIDPPIFVTYFLFFQIGWIIFKTDSLNKLSKQPVLQLSAATVLFFVLIFIPWPETKTTLVVREAISAFLCTLYVFGFLALFLKYLDRFSPRLNYIMEASYWVYIIHLPIVAFVPGLLSKWETNLFIKFTACVLATVIISFLTYQYLVRNTVVGKFLNGKIHRGK